MVWILQKFNGISVSKEYYIRDKIFMKIQSFSPEIYKPNYGKILQAYLAMFKKSFKNPGSGSKGR